MVATCGIDAMFYVLPMILGRTYDMNTHKVGIDIYDAKYLDEAKINPTVNPQVKSEYQVIEEGKEKRDFLGLTGELALQVSAGLLDIRGAGEYLRDTSSIDRSIEILVKVNYITMTKEIDLLAQPLDYWKELDPKTVGTHVVTSLTYGGELYASVNFVAHKEEDFQDIRAKVLMAISRQGAFDLDAQGKLEMLSQNLSSKAKVEIDYYGTVPVEGVPTTIKGLRDLVDRFKEQVEKVNNGNGVAICAGFRELAEWEDKFSLIKNRDLVDALDEFNQFFDNLREAQSLLKNFINSLPDIVSEGYMRKLSDFSMRLSDTLHKFYDVIGNLDIQQGTYQLNPAEKAFEENSKIGGDQRYTKEINKTIHEYNETAEEQYVPRAVYTHWGKSSCGPEATRLLYAGRMASFTEHGIGAGSNYQCLPVKPDFNLPSEYSGFNERTSHLAAVRYRDMSVFHSKDKKLSGKAVPCAVCETPERPTVHSFPGLQICPGDWVQEYQGWLVAPENRRNRAQFVCVDDKPDALTATLKGAEDPEILPVTAEDKSVACVVCSK